MPDQKPSLPQDENAEAARELRRVRKLLRDITGQRFHYMLKIAEYVGMKEETARRIIFLPQLCSDDTKRIFIARLLTATQKKTVEIGHLQRIILPNVDTKIEADAVQGETAMGLLMEISGAGSPNYSDLEKATELPGGLLRYMARRSEVIGDDRAKEAADKLREKFRDKEKAIDQLVTLLKSQRAPQPVRHRYHKPVRKTYRQAAAQCLINARAALGCTPEEIENGFTLKTLQRLAPGTYLRLEEADMKVMTWVFGEVMRDVGKRLEAANPEKAGPILKQIAEADKLNHN